MNGLVTINKPCGLSSSDVVIKCRNAYSHSLGKKIKCGHMGTLDPEATGVLVLGFGKAAKLFDLLQHNSKTYVAKIIFGKETDTLDREGNVIKTSNLPDIILIKDVLCKFIGKINQIPPKYSAISINGKRAYDLARSGKEVKLNARQVEIYNIEILDTNVIVNKCSELNILVECSSGTYIRSLVRDIAYELGVVAYMGALDRIKVGKFCKEDSVDLDDFIERPQNYVKSVLDVLREMLPIVEVAPQYRKKVTNGVKCEIGHNIPKLSALTIEGKIYCIAETNDNLTKSVVNLWEE